MKSFIILLSLFFVFNVQAEKYCMVKKEKDVEHCKSGDVVYIKYIDLALRYCEFDDEAFISVKGPIICRYAGDEREERKRK